ncbi:MAG: PKD domain-containing protein, partial [Thermoplasmata archaeon]
YSDWLGRRDTEVTHAYTAGGIYVVTVTVRDSDGAEHTNTSDITVVNAPPSVQVLLPGDTATVLEDVRVRFKGDGSDTPSDEGGLSYQWVIDGTEHDTDSTEHTFTRSGVYECVLHVTDPEGATTSVTVTVTVENMAPEATLEVDRTTVEAGAPVSYTVHLFDTPSDLEDLTVTWDFGDGNASTDVSGSHTFEAAGSYLVVVTVVDDDGSSVVDSVTITVSGPPVGPGDTNGGDDPSDPDDEGTDYLTLAAIVGAIAVTFVLVLLFLTRIGMLRGTGDDGDNGDQ